MEAKRLEAIENHQRSIEKAAADIGRLVEEDQANAATTIRAERADAQERIDALAKSRDEIIGYVEETMKGLIERVTADYAAMVEGERDRIEALNARLRVMGEDETPPAPVALLRATG